jgi:hypothetical protein
MTRPDDAERDLAAVGDEDAFHNSKKAERAEKAERKSNAERSEQRTTARRVIESGSNPLRLLRSFRP